MGIALAHAQQWKQAEQLWVKAEQLIGERRVLQKEEAIQSLAAALAHAHQWSWAVQVINMTGKGLIHAKMLSELGVALALAKQKDRAEQAWNEAEIMINSIDEKSRRAEAICELGICLSRANRFELLLRLIHTSWLQAETRTDILRLLPLATKFVALKPEIGISFFEAFYWVDNFLKI